MPKFKRQNLKSLEPKKKNLVKQKAHLKESNYLRNRMRQGITFLPGFVNTGYQTGTVVKNTTQSRNPESLFSESFQELIGQNNLRRSQRIHKKRNSSPDCDNNGALNRKARRKIQRRSKSIFKNINRQYSKQQKRHSPASSSDRSDQSSSMFEAEVSPTSEEHLCNEDAELGQTGYHQLNRTPQSKIDATEGSYRKTLCKKIRHAIQVSFKQNAVEQAKKRIQAEISKANAILAGKVVKKVLNISDSDVDLEEFLEENRNADNLFPVPSRKWVYCTPPNKKIATPKIEENQLEPAIILKEGNKIRKQKVQFCTEFDDCEENHVEKEYFRQIAKTKKTPSRNTVAPFPNSNEMYKVENLMRFHEYPHYARPYYDNHNFNEQHIFEENTNMIHFRNKKIESCVNEHDITVVMDGNNFEMQASQRRTSDVCFPNNSYEFNVNHEKIFNFSSQMSVFD